MPYSQAFNDVRYPLPAYDYDFNFYKTFDAQLRASAFVLAANAPNQLPLGAHDFFYNGDIPSWLALANTLRIKIAQRYEKRDPANITSVLGDIKTTFGSALIS